MSDALALFQKIHQVYGLLATTAGRDKVYRLFQYVARLVAWYLIRQGKTDTALRFINLRNGLLLARRAMRLFKNGEFTQAAIKLATKPTASLSTPGQIAHYAQIGRQLGYAGFMGTDQILWFSQIGFLRPDKERLQRIQRISHRCWLIGIIFSIISTSSSLVKLRSDGRRFKLQAAAARREGASEKSQADRETEEEERRAKGRALLAQRQTLLSQATTDLLDVWIPATSLGYTNLNDGVIGLFGAITSYTALQTLWLKHGSAPMAKK